MNYIVRIWYNSPLVCESLAPDTAFQGLLDKTVNVRLMKFGTAFQASWIIVLKASQSISDLPAWETSGYNSHNLYLSKNLTRGFDWVEMWSMRTPLHCVNLGYFQPRFFGVVCIDWCVILEESRVGYVVWNKALPSVSMHGTSICSPPNIWGLSAVIRDWDQRKPLEDMYLGFHHFPHI